MRSSKYIILFFCIGAILTMGCTDGRVDATLSHIDTLIGNHPDSALRMLDSLKTDRHHWARSQRMRYDLLRLKAENKAFVPLSSDSIAKELVSYYDTWGNANERMMANYLLGCCYRDMGEAPRAVDAYLDAISQADTTSNDCDFLSLSAIYSQMANIYNGQLLLTNEINARKKAIHYALSANQKYKAYYELKKTANAYILMNKKDSAEIVLTKVIESYFSDKEIQAALQASTSLLYLYVQKSNKTSESKQLIERYEAGSTLFDTNHELPPSKRQYYYYKGQYYENIDLLDSAEYYYRKVYYPNMPFTAFEPMYRGLLSVFSKRHQADSISKYAKLYCEVNDSSIAKKDQELTAHMAASYNYNSYQKEALENKAKVYKTRLALMIVLALILIASFIIWNRFQKNKKKKQQEIIALNTKYQNATKEYNQNLHTLQLLDNAHQEVIATIQKELEKTKSESEAYRSKLFEINSEYEETKLKLTEDNRRLTETLKSLERKEGLPNYIENTESFMNTEIVQLLKKLELIPLSRVTEVNWTKLTNEVSTYFPQLLNDLNCLPKMTNQKVRICLLVFIRIQDSCIANWLNQRASRISNIKSELNKELFGDNSARTLFSNLRQKYNIISSEKIN